MKTKFMLIISIILFMIAIIVLWKGNHTIGIALLMIAMLLNLIRGFINVCNKRRIK